jgi:betaine lipid synthase
MKETKFQQDIQYLPLPIRLSLVPIALVAIYVIQVQTNAFLVFKNDAYQNWTMSAIYVSVTLLVLFLVAWDQLKIPLKFMYSCFFKRIGHHGNDQQSRLEAFYQDQATSKTPQVSYYNAI